MIKVCNLFVLALHQEAEPIINSLKLLRLDLENARNFPNLDQKLFSKKHYSKLFDKFNIYVSGHSLENVLLVTGIGKINAVAGLSFSLELFQPTNIINIGLCGSLIPELKRGTIVNVVKVFQHDTYMPLKGFEDFLKHVDIKQKPWKLSDFTYASLATGDSFIDDPFLRHRIKSAGGDIVDMEGFAIAKIAEIYGIETHIYKIVSDNANDNAVEEFEDIFQMYNERVLELLRRIYVA